MFKTHNLHQQFTHFPGEKGLFFYGSMHPWTPRFQSPSNIPPLWNSVCAPLHRNRVTYWWFVLENRSLLSAKELRKRMELFVICVCRMEFRRSTSVQDKPLACLWDPGFGNGFLSSKGRLRRGLPTARTKALATATYSALLVLSSAFIVYRF